MNVKQVLQHAGGVTLDLLFPPRCIYCGKVIGHNRCENCESAVAKITRQCGMPVPHEGHVMDALQEAMAPFYYEEPVKQAIWRLKFDGEESLAAPYAAQMAKTVRAFCADVPFDCVVPVPAAKREGRNRCADAPQLLALALGKELKLPVCNFVQKVRETVPQHELSGTQRRQNLQNAFALTENISVQGKRILLVDDVFTTGTTSNECARVLCASGAKGVTALCIAVALQLVPG